MFYSALICIFEEMQHFFWQSLTLPCFYLERGKKKPWYYRIDDTGGPGEVRAPSPTFLQTKVYFLVVLPRFTSWNWLVWFTFSSVFTMRQCLHLHVTYYFKLTIVVVCKLHVNACAPRFNGLFVLFFW